MSCCGGLSAAAVQERGRALVDEAAARGALVKLVYTGDEVRTRAYVAEGRPYFFGVNKPINAVPARVVPQFLDPQGRYYGSFELFAETAPSGLSTNPDVTSAGIPQGPESTSKVAASTVQSAAPSTLTPAQDEPQTEAVKDATASGRKRGKDAG